MLMFIYLLIGWEWFGLGLRQSFKYETQCHKMFVTITASRRQMGLTHLSQIG